MFAAACTLIILLGQFACFCCTVVETKSGKIEGLELSAPNGKSVYAFLGIPYAKAPLGDLRFKAPEAVSTWDDVLKADRKPKACIQDVPEQIVIPHFDWFIDQETEQSEDCLYLNIWTPRPRPVKAAVMIWIHGGAYHAGSCSMDKYDGQILSTEEEVVVVCINYRVSIFGFFYLNSTDGPGNQGIMDQTMALKWVHENIENFGGDSAKITIFGESAGSASVEHHMLLPTSQGMFQRAILMSGTELSLWPDTPASTLLSVSKKVVRELSCEENTETCLTEEFGVLDNLRNKETKEILEAFRKASPGGLLLFHPVKDGTFISDKKERLIKDGNLNKEIDIMTGFTKEDGSFCLGIYGLKPAEDEIKFSDEQLLSFIKLFAMIENNQTAELIKFLYRSWEEQCPTDVHSDAAVRFATDYFLACGTYLLLEYVLENGNRAYAYEFDYAPSNRPGMEWLGSTHGDEIDFVFGKPLDLTRSYPEEDRKLPSEEEKKLSLETMKLFANFAKYGDPTTSSKQINKWPLYTEEKKQFFYVGLDMEARKARRIPQCRFWNTIYPELKEHLI